MTGADFGHLEALAATGCVGHADLVRRARAAVDRADADAGCSLDLTPEEALREAWRVRDDLARFSDRLAGLIAPALWTFADETARLGRLLKPIVDQLVAEHDL